MTKILTDDVADASNFVPGAIERSEFLHSSSTNRVLQETKTKKGQNAAIKKRAQIIMVQKEGNKKEKG